MVNRRLVRLLAGGAVVAVSLMTAGVALAICHPSLGTIASPGVVGQPVTDSAQLRGGSPSWPPTGTITWKVYSASDTSCSTPLFTSAAVTVDGDGTYTSPPFTPTAPGSYQWVASYSGDSWNAPISGNCNDSHEQFVVSKASPSIATSAASGTAGQPITDSATLSGGDSPSGSITWSVYSASDTSCATALFTSAPVTVSGDGTYTSPSYTPTSAGTYQWVANYSGDANNNPVASACGDTSEQSTVGAAPAPPTPTSTTPTSTTPTKPGAVKSKKVLRCGRHKVKKHKKVHGKKVTVCVAKKKVSAAARRRTLPSFTG